MSLTGDDKAKLLKIKQDAKKKLALPRHRRNRGEPASGPSPAFAL
jgi:hypothetical protein